ncbi:Crp/Fnr family transcriptional regulator [Nitrosospira multiformis]|uniref:cAMP-binding domain of CRP or a regulatory subunit of cAMP-dependent protein kinases n=1 Tax=Nitrosospira multiformis TaxID=1231 RepID=A0A1I7I9Y3_9PROT|nr:Crp/Fnr family transcriptional regulator [Nitrosospira multiformis]SFU69751.1 cAMP-binding domain of CRP or a regulatory subunit of cAMP-dependent protein kinases [Nitrosospira multiformis]
MSTFHPHHPTQNRLLAALPPIELADLAPHLELIHLPLGDALCKPGEPLPYAYFPTSSVISIHCLLENGTSSELTSVGREGMLGVSLFLGGEDTQSWASVQSAGYGYRLKAAFLLQEFNEGGLLQRLLLRYSHALVTEAAQNVACSRYHTAQQRLCRWLMSTWDRLGFQELILTQESIASILGIRRESVTAIARKLQEAGTICYRRGRIMVTDQASLQREACECYGIIKKELEQVFDDVRACEKVRQNSIDAVNML